MMECFGSYREGEGRCEVCDVKEYCEKYVIAVNGGCQEFGNWSDKENVCKICESVFGLGCKDETERRRRGEKNKGIRKWADECLERGIFADEFTRLALERWGRKLYVIEHVRYRSEKWGWEFECKEIDGRKFWKLVKRGKEVGKRKQDMILD